MNRAVKLGSGFGLGAALMYLLDPQMGRRRRATLRDKAVRIGKDATWIARLGASDIAQRTKGAVYKGKHLVTSEEVIDDIVVERVRSALGRVSIHPGGIEVSARRGVVTLRGPILQREAKRVVSAAREVRGVKEVHDQLRRHKQAGTVPGLQGGAPRRADVPEALQENWTPAYRVAAAGAGAGLLAYALKRGGYPGVPAGISGAALLIRGVANQPFRRLIGIGAGRRAVDVQKTLEINAPVDQVFAAWTNYQNFPRFMTHLEEVRSLGGGRSHWVAKGPAGIRVSWDAEITEQIQNRVFAWKSLPGSTVENAGIVRFEPAAGGGTRLSIRMSYNPPAGSLGHGVAWLLGSDLKQEIDEDLNRLKRILERKVARASGGEKMDRERLFEAPGQS
jgi:uncharacterized membrane protein